MLSRRDASSRLWFPVRSAPYLVTVLLALSASGCASTDSPDSGDENLRATIAAMQAKMDASSQPTAIGVPAATVASATETAAPAEGGMLDVGEAKVEEGFTLRLVKAETVLGIGEGVGPGIEMLFDLTNGTTNNIPVRYGQENFEAKSNLGKPLDVGQAHDYNGLLGTIEAQEAMMEPGTTLRIPWGGSRSAIIYVSCDVADPAITEAYVTVRDIGHISSATFRVRLPH